MTANRPSVRIVLACAVATCLSAGAVDLSAQSLGAVAREEAARRQAATSGKVYTNDSLTPDPRPVVPAAQASTPGAGGATADAAAGQKAASDRKDASPEKKDAAPEKKDEAYWREKAKGLRDARSRAESFAEALQSRINALSNDFVNRDDPAQRNLIAADRQKALDELARVKKEVQEYTKALDDLQSEARREGVPPGWLR